MVSPCPSVAENGDATKWENITPPGVQNPQAMALDPFHIGTIWLGTAPNDNGASTPGGGLYKSTDCGATWSHVNTGAHGAELDQASIWSMAVDFKTPGVLYVIGAHGPVGLWKSTNGGVDWTQLLPSTSELAKVSGGDNPNPPPPFVGNVSMDPKDPLHLVIGLHTNCSAPHNANCGAETTDGGATWTIFDLPGDGWAEQTGPYVLDATTWLYATLFGGLWRTTDRGSHWAEVLSAEVATGATGGEYTHRPLAPAADGAYYLPSYNPGGLLKSTDEGATWSAVPVGPTGSYELGLALSSERVFLGDMDGAGFDALSLKPPSEWKKLPAAPTENGGSVYMEYDEAHHLLYSTNWSKVQSAVLRLSTH
jgi:photosystem II stability/assembly factor-like uncharacterized protein